MVLQNFNNNNNIFLSENIAFFQIELYHILAARKKTISRFFVKGTIYWYIAEFLL